MNLAAFKNVKVSTKSLVAALTAFGALMQVSAVSGFVYKLTATHPNVAGALTALVGIAALLHNPQVQAILGVQQTVTVETTTVDVAPPAKEAKP